VSVGATYTIVAVMPDGSQLPDPERVALALANALGPFMPDDAFLTVACPGDSTPIDPSHPAFEL